MSDNILGDIMIIRMKNENTRGHEVIRFIFQDQNGHHDHGAAHIVSTISQLSFQIAQESVA